MALTPKIITGLPTGAKEKPRIDFKPSEFDQAIVTKGYRMFWSRTGLCPCLVNDQTEQPDPTCSLCNGNAYYKFLPDPALTAGVDAYGNAVTLNDDGDAVLIYVIMTSLTQDKEVFEKFGEYLFGMARATTQAQNKLGYRDRLVAYDSEMTWAQIIEYDGANVISITGERSKAGLRYPMVAVHILRSLSRVYVENDDFKIDQYGRIEWLANQPNSGTRLSIHGTIHPVWVVMDHLNTYRDTQLEGGGGISSQKFQKLPVQAICKLEFLVNP